MRPAASGLAPLALLAVALASGGGCDAPAWDASCDVLAPGCATTIARLVAERYEAPWSATRRVWVQVGSPAGPWSPDYGGVDLDARVGAQPVPLAGLLGTWSDAGDPRDPALAEGPAPSGLGRVDTLLESDDLAYVISPGWVDDEPDLARRRLAGLVAGVASRLRHERDPEHPVDGWTWSESHSRARWAWRMGFGRALLGEVESPQGSPLEVAGGVAAEAAALFDVAWDEAHTPSRHPVSDVARYAGVADIARRRAAGATWSDLEGELVAESLTCLRELVWPEAAPCVALGLPAEVEGGDQGLWSTGARQIEAVALTHRLRALGWPDAEEAGSQLAGHVGLVRYRPTDGAALTEDVLRFDTPSAAASFAAAVSGWPGLLQAEVDGADVRLVGADAAIDPAPWLAHLAGAHPIDHPPAP